MEKLHVKCNMRAMLFMCYKLYVWGAKLAIFTYLCSSDPVMKRSMWRGRAGQG